MASPKPRTRLSCLAVPLLLLSAGPARAGEPDDTTAAIPVSAPWYTPMVLNADAPPPLAAQPWILYTNFDGGQMEWCGFGNNDPKGNCSHIMQDTVLPFTGDAGRRAAVVQVIRQDFKDFNISVTDVRPPDSVDYDMEMIGDWSPAPGGGFAGVAPSIDCWNGDGGEVSFTLDYTSSATGIAKAVLQEAAHTWGLEHVDSKLDLLYPTTESVVDPTFVDECFQIVQLDDNNQPVPSGAQCGQQHTMFCGSNTKQNSYQELLQIFGPHEADLTAPVVEISEPAEGAVLGGSFDLKISASDNQTPQLLVLGLNLEGPKMLATDPASYPAPAELTFPIKGLPAGDYTATVEVEDEDGNLATDVVHFTVMGATEPGDSTGGDEPGATATSADTTGEPTTAAPDEPTTAAPTPDPTTGPVDATTGPAPDTSGGADGDEGCSCRSQGAAPTPLALLALLGLVRARRRPRA